MNQGTVTDTWVYQNNCLEKGHNEEHWKLVLDGEEFIFIIESKLNELMEQFQDLLIAPFYHFALWCVDPEA